MSLASEVSLISLGLTLAVFGGALLWRATAVHPADVTTVRVGAGVLSLGCILIAPGAIASGIKGVGSAVAEAWRARQTP